MIPVCILDFLNVCIINLYCYVSAESRNGPVISNRPLRDSELFEVRITEMNVYHVEPWSIRVGITILQPGTMELPDTLYSILSKTWWMSGCHIWLNQELLTSNYGINLNSLKVSIHR